MKILNKLLGTALLALVIMLAVPQKTKAQFGDDEISFQTFYDELSPYGTWIDDPEYGDVWVPDAGSDFRPYATNGHWVVTDYGNTWVSDYEWGWAPFHYGRWHFDDYYGWEWVPDYEWGPAWVDWRSADGYYGWAPLTPGISLDIAFGGGYTIPDNYWVFAPGAYITSPYIYNYYVPRTRIAGYMHRGNFIRNTYADNGNHRYITGPRPNEIQRFTHNRVNVYHINNASRPGSIRVQNNQVNIYRPRVQNAPDARPSRVVDATAYRRANPNQRIANHGVGVAPVNHQNAQRLANFARTAPADNKIVHENNHSRRPGENNNSDRNTNRPAGIVTPPGNSSNNRPAWPEVPHTDGNPTPVTRPGQPQQNRDEQMQRRQQYQQRQQDQQRNTAGQQQRDQQRQQYMQQRQQQQAQQQAAQQQQNQQRNAAEQQQREQQRQQYMQQRQQQQAAQQNQQRNAAEQQQREQQRQQQMQLRQQQQDQQRQQQAAQQRQQQDQQRQQQADQQRQQQAAQQRQQQDQQRQQQADQQRQQQRQQQRPPRETRPERPQR